MGSKKKLLEGIHRFVREHSLELTAEDNDTSVVKKLRKKFFIEKYNKKFGIPNLGELANETIRYLINVGQIRDIEEIQKIISKSPFLEKYVDDFSIFEEDFNRYQGEPQLTVDDLKRMKQREYLKKVEDQIRDKVVQEQVEEIREGFEKEIADLEEVKKQKEEEYLSIPSMLDESTFEEPSLKVEVRELEEDWWRTLGLRDDPFPTYEGLSRIPKELFEKIVVKTKIFQDYLDRIERGSGEILNKGILIIGDFGSGKTTFFDYLPVYLIDKKIKPIRLTMLPFNDPFTYFASFEVDLFNELNEFYRDRFGYYFQGSANTESIQDIMGELCEKEYWRFLIILDDLHKHKGVEETVITFLSNLQIFKDKLVRKNLDVGFLISGLPIWETYLRKEESLGGFINAIDYIPQVEPRIAYAVIKKRIEAYAVNPEKCNAINIDFINKIYRKALHEGSFRGYRTFIRSIIDEFKRGNFDILETQIEIERDTLKFIQRIIEENGRLKKAFDKFIFGSRIEREINRERGLECLIRTYLSQGITEDDPFFESNKYHFQKLKNAGLIQKSKIDGSHFKWRISQDLFNANEKILRKYNLSLEDYLVKLYIKTPRGRQIKTLRAGETDKINKFLEEFDDLLGASVSDLVKSSFTIYDNISEIDQSKFPPLYNFISDCKRSLAYLSKAVFTYERIIKIPEKDEDVLKLWATHWISPNGVAHFMNQVSHYASETSSEKVNEIIAIIRVDFKEAYTELFDILKEQIELERRVFPMPFGDLTREEINNLNEIRKMFADKKTEDTYFNIIKKLTEDIEQKLRKFLFISLHLLYGSYDQRKERIEDPEIGKYISLKPEVIAHPTFDERSYNEFENLNRGQYKSLILDNPFRNRIFKHVFRNFPELPSFIEFFCDKNVSISHGKKEEVSRVDETSSVMYYISRCIDFTKRLNSAYYKFLREYAYRKLYDSEKSYFFSLETLKKPKEMSDRITKKQIYDLEEIEPKDFSELTPVKLADEEKKRITDQLNDLIKSNPSGFYRLNIERYDELVRLFNIEYRKLVAILAELYQQGEISTEKEYGPEIRISFSSNRGDSE